MKTFRNLSPWLFGFLLLSGVGMTSSCTKFDKVGLDNATNLSTMLSDLMAKATGKYSANTDAINKATAALEKAVSHAASVKNNTEIADAWKALQTDLVGPFLVRWKEKGMLDKDVVKESTAQVVKSLEAIRKSEMAKKK